MVAPVLEPQYIHFVILMVKGVRNSLLVMLKMSHEVEFYSATLFGM